MNPRIGVARSLLEHPSSLSQFGFSHAWLESPLAATLSWLKDVRDWSNLDRWPNGRIFGLSGEYRWQRNPERKTIHAVLLLDEAPLLEGFEELIELCTPEDSALILWGDWIDPTKDPQSNSPGDPLFYANEIPQQALSYPVENWQSPPLENFTPRLIIRRYRDRDEKQGEFLRCVTVEMRRRDNYK